MSRAYSSDLRQRIVDAVASGKSRRAAAADFKVSVATAVRLKQRLDRTGSIEPSRRGRRPDSGKLGPLRDVILAKVEAQPDITMADLAAWLAARRAFLKRADRRLRSPMERTSWPSGNRRSMRCRAIR